MNNRNSRAKASFITGIISCAFGAIECFKITVFIAIILGGVAIAMGASSLRYEKNKYAISGVVLGITGILIACIWLHMMIGA